MQFFVPATSANLGPGFDTLGVALGLYNSVEITKSSFSSVSIKGEGERYLKTKGGNIFLNIFNKKYRELTGREDTFRFKFENNIPISRGLGSSSAVIVLAIYSAYVMSGVEVDKDIVLKEALVYESHPDNISPATFGGLNIAAVHHGEIYRIKHDLDDELRAVVVIPDKPISTKASRNALPKRIPMQDVVFNVSRSSLLVAAFMQKNYELLRVASEDRLHQNIRMRFLPQLFDVQKKALASGAIMSTLSGSGSTFFNLARNSDDAEKIALNLKNSFRSFRVEILSLDSLGVRSQD